MLSSILSSVSALSKGDTTDWQISEQPNLQQESQELRRAANALAASLSALSLASSRSREETDDQTTPRAAPRDHTTENGTKSQPLVSPANLNTAAFTVKAKSANMVESRNGFIHHSPTVPSKTLSETFNVSINLR